MAKNCHVKQLFTEEEVNRTLQQGSKCQLSPIKFQLVFRRKQVEAKIVT